LFQGETEEAVTARIPNQMKNPVMRKKKVENVSNRTEKFIFGKRNRRGGVRS